MTARNPAIAIAKLVRLREFAQARESATFTARSAAVARARECVALAMRDTDATHVRINGLLTEHHLDLGRLQMLSEIEHAAWSRAQAAEQALTSTIEQQTAARDAHRRARTQTQVASTRLAQVVAVHADQEEKRTFDHMADLHRATARRPR